jgi:hypothetical protein
MYVMPPWLGSGAAMAATTLVHSLWLAKQKLGQLPDTLYLQSDNGSENKNRAILYLLCLLVHYNVFVSIHWNLLCPGHTHEDIDGWFGVVSRWLAKVFLATLG